MPESLLTLREVCDWLKLDDLTVRRMCKRKELDYTRVGKKGALRFNPDDVRAYLTGRKNSAQ